MMATAKRTVVDDDVPGIFTKPNRTPLKRVNRKLTKAEADAAEKALDEWANAPPWRVWFDALGPKLEAAAKSPDANVASAADYGLHIWRCIADDLAKPARQRRTAEWYVEWAMKLRWEMAKVNLWPLDNLTKIGRRQVQRPRNMRHRKAELAAEKKSENYDRAQDALEWARQQYPMAAADNSIDFLKAQAAKHLDVCKRTLNRWLESPQ